MSRTLWVHPEVEAGLRDVGQPAVHRRYALATRTLLAHGRTGVTKATRGENAGWLRSPIGGTHGQQYYLWWRILPHEGGAPDLWLRAVRHHDDHTPLTWDLNAPGRRTLELADVRAPDVPTWTPEQQRFLTSGHGAKVLQGAPGSGKTTALWAAIEGGPARNVLYVTWSRALADEARGWFGTVAQPLFGPEAGQVRAWDFVTLVGAVLQRDLHRLDPRKARAAVTSAIHNKRLLPRELDLWKGAEGALADELRAHLLGRFTRWTHEGRLAIDEGAAIHTRTQEGLPRNATHAACYVASRLDLRDPAMARRFFPDVVAALEATHRVSSGELPRELEGLDALFIDEAQDLTVAELRLAGSLAARVQAPLTLAGDEGQTVLPTAFSWTLGIRAAGMPDRVPRHKLQGSLRNTAAVAQVVERAGELYRRVDKGARPRGQGPAAAPELGDGIARWVSVPKAAEAAELLEAWAAGGGVVICTSEDLPAWLPAEQSEAVLTPATAKGLEFERVCVVGASEALARLDVDGRVDQLDRLARRLAIDGLRVAVSRATQALAVLTVAPSEQTVTRLRDWIGEEASAYELPHLGQDLDMPRAVRVAEQLALAEQAADGRPQRAWTHLTAAAELGAAEAELATEVESARVRLGLRLLLRDDLDLQLRAVVLEQLGRGAHPLVGLLDVLSRPLAVASSRDRATWLLGLATLPEVITPPWLVSELYAQRHRLRAALGEVAVAWDVLAAAPPGALERAASLLEAHHLLERDGHPVTLDDLRLDAADRARAASNRAAELALLRGVPSVDRLRLAEAAEAAGEVDLAYAALLEVDAVHEALALARRHARFEEVAGLARRAGATVEAELGAQLVEVDLTLRRWVAEATLTAAERERLTCTIGTNIPETLARVADAEAAVTAQLADLQRRASEADEAREAAAASRLAADERAAAADRQLAEASWAELEFKETKRATEEERARVEALERRLLDQQAEIEARLVALQEREGAVLRAQTLEAQVVSLRAAERKQRRELEAMTRRATEAEEAYVKLEQRLDSAERQIHDAQEALSSAEWRAQVAEAKAASMEEELHRIRKADRTPTQAAPEPPATPRPEPPPPAEAAPTPPAGSKQRPQTLWSFSSQHAITKPDLMALARKALGREPRWDSPLSAAESEKMSHMLSGRIPPAPPPPPPPPRPVPSTYKLAAVQTTIPLQPADLCELARIALGRKVGLEQALSLGELHKVQELVDRRPVATGASLARLADEYSLPEPQLIVLAFAELQRQPAWEEPLAYHERIVMYRALAAARPLNPGTSLSWVAHSLGATRMEVEEAAFRALGRVLAWTEPLEDMAIGRIRADLVRNGALADEPPEVADPSDQAP